MQTTVAMAMIAQKRIASKYIVDCPSLLSHLAFVFDEALFGVIIAQLCWLDHVCLGLMGGRCFEW